MFQLLIAVVEMKKVTSRTPHGFVNILVHFLVVVMLPKSLMNRPAQTSVCPA